VRWICLAPLLVSLGGVPAHAQSVDTARFLTEAEAAARQWLALVDRVEYGASWDSSASAFRAALTKPEWEQALLQARGPLEPLVDRNLIDSRFTTSLPKAPPGQFVVLQYETKASKERTVVETVVPMREADGEWRVSGYFIRLK
jgi:hypothetical protein